MGLLRNRKILIDRRGASIVQCEQRTSEMLRLITKSKKNNLGIAICNNLEYLIENEAGAAKAFAFHT